MFEKKTNGKYKKIKEKKWAAKSHGKRLRKAQL